MMVNIAEHRRSNSLLAEPSAALSEVEVPRRPSRRLAPPIRGGGFGFLFWKPKEEIKSEEKP